MITINDVADEVGVSATTISNVLNNNAGTVSEEKRQRILETIEKMGYRPNRRARQFRKQSSLTIAIQLDAYVVTNNVWRPTVALTMLLMQGISSHAQSRGYHTYTLISEFENGIEDVRSQLIKQNAVDGIIFGGFQGASDEQLEELIEELKACNIPAVTLDYRLHSLGMPFVSHDLFYGTSEAADRLAELGHTCGAYIGKVERQVARSRVPRFMEFQARLAGRGIDLPDELVCDAVTEIDIYRKTLELVDGGDLPTFIIFSSDHFAIAGLEALNDRGVKVPGDVSVVSVDNAPYAQNLSVPLSTIDMYLLEHGRTMAGLLLDRVEGRNASTPEITFIRSKFIERDSTGRARGR